MHSLSYVARPLVVLLTLLAVGAAILAAFASLLGFAANFLLLPASRRFLYGLVTTYVAGPGAPEWIASRRNIIALPIPSEINTLTFEMIPDQRKNLIKSAYQATYSKPQALLPERNQSNGHNG
jgi:hypothetical protein